MSGGFDSRKDSQSTKFEQRPQIFRKLSFRELCDSTLSGLHIFDKMAIIHYAGQKQKGKSWVLETPIHEVTFVTLTEKSSIVTDDTQGPLKYPHHWKQAVGTHFSV